LLVAGREGKGTNMAKFPTKKGEREGTGIPLGEKKKEFDLYVPPLVLMVINWSMLKI